MTNGLTSGPDWLEPLSDEAKLEYNDIFQEYYEKRDDLHRELHDDIQALYLEHHPDVDKEIDTEWDLEGSPEKVALYSEILRGG